MCRVRVRNGISERDRDASARLRRRQAFAQDPVSRNVVDDVAGIIHLSLPVLGVAV